MTSRFSSWPEMLLEMQTEVFHRLDPYSGQALAMTSAGHLATFGKENENPASIFWFNARFNIAHKAHPRYIPYNWRREKNLEEYYDAYPSMFHFVFSEWLAGLATRNDPKLFMQYVNAMFRWKRQMSSKIWTAIYGTNNHTLIELAKTKYSKSESLLCDHERLTAIVGSRFTVPDVAIIEAMHGSRGPEGPKFCFTVISACFAFNRGKVLVQCAKRLQCFDSFFNDVRDFVESYYYLRLHDFRSDPGVTFTLVEILQCLVDMKEIFPVSESTRTYFSETIAHLVAEDTKKIPHVYEALSPLIKELCLEVSLDH